MYGLSLQMPVQTCSYRIEGIKLDLVILNKKIESSTYRQENGLESELLVTKKHCEELQQNIQLIKNAQNAEVEELNRTIHYLKTKASKAEEERDSLRFALSLVMQQYDEIPRHSNVTHEETNKAKKSSPEERPVGLQQRKSKESELPLTNRFEGLQDENDMTTNCNLETSVSSETSKSLNQVTEHFVSSARPVHRKQNIKQQQKILNKKLQLYSAYCTIVLDRLTRI